jgi:hypothetical protein
MASYKTRSDAAAPIAKSLREFGYPDASTEMLKEVIDAYLAGDGGSDLPHGIIGRMAESQIEEIEENRPGFFAGLENR